MPGMIAAGICRYGHTIAAASDLLIKRNNSTACLHCYRLVCDEREHIRRTPLWVPRSRRPETDWVHATIKEAGNIGGYIGDGWPVGK